MQSFSSIRQRGIFSEVVNPENASQFGTEILHGPSASIVLHQNKKQKIPKAISLNQKMEDQFQFKVSTDIITVDPKVMEPNDPIPGRVPRKVAIDRKKKEYASFDLNVLMSQVDQAEHWLPLELFDDITFDDFSNEEWMERAKEEQALHHALIAKGLLLNKNTMQKEWKPILITNYDEKSQMFEVVPQNPKNPLRWDYENKMTITRINFCLDAEDPRKFMKRVEMAYKERMFYDSLIRYNYYIDNMPMQDLNELDSEQKKRLENLCKTKKLEQEEMSGLIQEVNNDYTRTMNKIIFDKFLEDNENEQMFPEPLNLPKQETEVVSPYFGMQQISQLKKEAYMTNHKEIFYGEQKDFTDIFQDFCFASLYIKEEVIKALQDITVECNNISSLHMFHLHDLPSIMRLEEFKHIQDSATSQILYTLKGSWVNELIKIIKLQFQSVGKGWFNMKETSKVTYDFGKLKRFLTVVRLVMQDTLLSLVQKSYFSFYEFITSFIPQKVEIHDSNKVENFFENYKRPLFTIELFKTLSEDAFVYNTNPQQFINVLLQIFDKGLEEISKIPDLEPKILSDLYKSQKNEMFIKAPMKPREKPLEPSSFRQVPDENKWIHDLHLKLKSSLTEAIKPLNEYIMKFEKFKDVLLLKPDDYVQSLEMAEVPKEPAEIQAEIYAFQKKEELLKQEIPLEIHVSCFKIQCTELYNYLIEKFQTVQKNLIQLIAKRCREATTQIFNSFETIKSKLKETPTDIEKLTELKEYMGNLPQELLKVQQEISKTTNIYGILESFNHRFTKEEMNKKWLIIAGPKETYNLMEQRKKTLDKDQVKFLDQMKNQQEEFKATIDNLERTIQNFHQHQKLENHQDISQDVMSVNEQLQRYQEDARKFNMQESLFEMNQQTDYAKLNTMVKDFQPYSNLWLAANKWFTDYPKWLNGPFAELKATDAEKFVEDSIKTLSGVLRYFKDRDIEPMCKITDIIKVQLDQFRPKVPLMVALRKEGMKERHWQQISDKVNFVVKPTGDEFCFQDILDMNLLEHSEMCCEIGERAEKEFNIENMLQEMFGIWENINFELPSYKETTHIIKGCDKIQEILDEHIINTQAMQFSPFKKPFEQDIINWNEQLKLMSDVLEEWMKCQGQWMYLQPIFDSPDIAKQLPQETKKFKTVDTTWRHTMQQAKNLQKVLEVCTSEGLLERLQEANKNLELIQKELNNYLEKKREKFARFYFLSNDDLLEILSQTKEPTAVQSHLKKVFEAIQLIEFDEKKKIHAMFSAEKERVPFTKPVDPNNKNVEDWMGELEDMMKASVRQVVFNSIQTYPNPTRCDWVLCNPGQAVLNGSQVLWTQEVETAIKSQALPKYFEKLQTQLFEMVELVRTPISDNQMITLNALIVIDVHAKDVVENLVKSEINDTISFEWISQLRYYWENDDLYCKCIQTNFPYGYEYLGNSLRLVITPLTDKCYMTLMGALKIHLGGAPAGPAGTGKTETTKDLAKALAKQCVVFNCSDSMDYLMVGKFFKGLASAGAWACFDEFNRINIEVLSVIGQQLLLLFTEKSKGTPRVLFEDSDIKLNPNFCVFITMNPGYAGRTELPDNLKALFRSVAMMVPDYSLIGEIMLYSFGFLEGRILAKKMVFTFKLCSEQLSSQCHYDYGMRAVRSVINAAGLLKRASPEMAEDKLMLRSLRDVNVPKFLKDDLPLFENIIKDLFPGVDKPMPEYGGLMDQLDISCKEMNLQCTQSFIDKIQQLYDTIQVRHGLMLVGPTGGGKTSNYVVLQHALSALMDDGFYKVHTHKLNPKSIKMGQLYGEFNDMTHEWTDGILAYMIRETVKDLSGEKHWIVFDGPVDAIWIENMNTVLDDNKKLCLNSGQILTLTPHMTMMFEVEDLEVASPATVSRCGMVYMEPVALGMKPIVDSWLQQLLPNLTKLIKPKLNTLFDKYIYSLQKYVRLQVREVQPTRDNNLVASLTHILDCFLENYRETEARKITGEDLENLSATIEAIFMFALTWSFGCTGDSVSRDKFNLHIKELTDVFPAEGTIYDYYFDTTERRFVAWTELFKEFEINNNHQYHEIMIPNVDSTRNTYLTTMLVQQGYHVLCPGPTGTCKSMNIYAQLNQMGDNYQYIAITFSAQTSANQTQDTIDSKMDKRRRGYYGPPVGKKCIIFIDDLNMPKKETYGAQPPIEILRQYMDHKGWYNRKDLQFMFIEDVTILSAMRPPGGGNPSITMRFLRHFNILAYTELSFKTITAIFSRMTKHFLKRFQDCITKHIPTITEQVLHIYDTVKSELLPTPKKSHYTFNLRDIWKVFQGICSASQKYSTESVDIVRLYFHENMRVFYDRLIEKADQELFQEILYKSFPLFQLTKEEVMDQERIIYADFLYGRDADPRQYCQVKDLPQLLYKMESFQDDYNSDPQYVGGNKKQMKLVMFLDACEHIARISRIIRQPQGNALILGVGGSGRQSLSKMASFIMNYKIFQIEVVKNYNMRTWREDVKKCLMMAGVDNKPVSFLFVDTQIINEQMLEDINNILNSGDVTNIYQEKDMEEIQQACKADCLKRNMQPNKMNIFSCYIQRVKRNVHLIICMSQLSNLFASRLRQFPSLVNCCTLDWFSEWPEEALLGVGKGSIQESEQELGIEDHEVQRKLINMFKNIHKSVESYSIRFYTELRRYTYVTPTSYLELLSIYKQILNQKRQELTRQVERLKGGLDKLNGANVAVEEMKVTLTDMQPKLEKASIETQQMMESLSIDKQEASVQQKQVSQEEKEATAQAEEAAKLAREAEMAVADANDSLSRTLEEVKKLKKEHLVEIKSFTNPSDVIVIVLQAVIILVLDKIKDKGGDIQHKIVNGKKEEDYFGTAKMFLLNDPKDLLDILMKYDRDAIQEKQIKRLEAGPLQNPKWSLEAAQKSSYAVQFLWSWVKAMSDYYKVYTTTQPLREKLVDMKKIVSDKTEELLLKKAALDKVNARIQDLENQFNEKIQQKEQLTSKINECQLKLDRAQKLTEGLSEEKIRWGNDIEIMSKSFDFLPGDSLIGAGMVSYSGCFTANFREQMEQEWIVFLQKQQLQFSDGIRMISYLGEPVKIQTWNIAGLPKNDTSIENGIIIDKSRRWPLMIDPQNQANKYIKNMGKDQPEGIDQIKASDQNLMRTLELAIQFGKWVLLENVGQNLDPSLEPILQQQVIKQGQSLSIAIGDKNIPYNEKFKFFMTTTLPNPHYSPETSVKVTIINFAITPQGLEDQMLAILVGLENPNLEQKKIEIVRKNASDKKELLNIEDSILKSLSEQKGDISELLMDETLINKLQSSKKFAAEINQRLKDSKVTEEMINTSRESYRSVAFRASILFFCINDLALIDHMYQYSLQWFTQLFESGVENAPASTQLEVRLQNLNDFFTYSLYQNVCRSLFEMHKMLFSTLLTHRILSGSHNIDHGEWRYLLTGPSGEVAIPQNPLDWIQDNKWPDLYRNVKGIEALPILNNFEKVFLEQADAFRVIFDSLTPQTEPIPYFDDKLNEFQKILILKIIRPDKVIPAVQSWISNSIGQQYILAPSFELAKCFKDSNQMTPLLIILSAGSDPVTDFLKFAEEQQKTTSVISLGQGQGPRAEKMIKEQQARGGWVLLQNCHLCVSWLPELERIVEELNDNIHRDFRLWLTSMPSGEFPISILQNGVKMTIEPPKGLRNNLLRTYGNLSDKELNDCKKPEIFKKLLFSLCLFHAVILDRRKFGPIGWNIQYDFTNEDLQVSKIQLKMLLDDYNQVPYKVINYLISDINYGGRVTDDKDVKLIRSIVSVYVNAEALNDNCKFSKSGIYVQPVAFSQAEFINYISNFPLIPLPEAFGLHENADITNAQNETSALLETILSLEPKSAAGAGKSREEIISDIAIFVQKGCPKPYLESDIIEKFPVSYEESMNTVLFQEVVRYNKLLIVMESSLIDIQKALMGKIVMSDELEGMANSLFDNQVPLIWSDKGFLSLKPLAAWNTELIQRITFINDWINNGTPNHYWIPGFFFPQAFFTGIMQNFARKYTIPIDKITFDMIPRDDLVVSADLEKPENGCLIHGMFLEGARWDASKHLLTHSKPKELFTDFPMMHLAPIMDRVAPEDNIYECPIYKVVSRKGTLMTTGHSTNFVMYMELATKESKEIWIRAGVAGFISLKY